MESTKTKRIKYSKKIDICLFRVQIQEFWDRLSMSHIVFKTKLYIHHKQENYNLAFNSSFEAS